jgi:hypothetical protein
MTKDVRPSTLPRWPAEPVVPSPCQPRKSLRSSTKIRGSARIARAKEISCFSPLKDGCHLLRLPCRNVFGLDDKIVPETVVRPPPLPVCRIELPVADIVRNGAAEQMRRWSTYRDGNTAIASERGIILSVDPDGARCGLVESADQVDDGTFPGTVSPTSAMTWPALTRG